MAKTDPDAKSFVEGIFQEFEKLHKKIDERLPEKKAEDKPAEPTKLPEPKSFWDFFFSGE